MHYTRLHRRVSVLCGLELKVTTHVYTGIIRRRLYFIGKRRVKRGGPVYATNLLSAVWNAGFSLSLSRSLSATVYIDTVTLRHCWDRTSNSTVACPVTVCREIDSTHRCYALWKQSLPIVSSVNDDVCGESRCARGKMIALDGSFAVLLFQGFFLIHIYIYIFGYLETGYYFSKLKF